MMSSPMTTDPHIEFPEPSLVSSSSISGQAPTNQPSPAQSPAIPDPITSNAAPEDITIMPTPYVLPFAQRVPTPLLTPLDKSFTPLTSGSYLTLPVPALDAGTSSASQSTAHPDVLLDDRALGKDKDAEWDSAYNDLVKRDEKMLKSYLDSIDSLLIFAGLFSAVVTAFVVQTYQNLQEDYNKSSKILLSNILKRLSDSSAALEDSTFVVDQSDVRVNILWFISLVLSLGTALLGIFLKQWLQAYMSWVHIYPVTVAIAVRGYRNDAMDKWGLHSLVKYLPIWLQLSLVLFSAGLIEFCRDLNLQLSRAVGSAIGMCLLLVTAITLMPLLSASSPFRSPWSPHLAKIKRKMGLWRRSQSSKRRVIRQHDPKKARAVALYNTGANDKVSGVETWDDMDQLDIEDDMENGRPSWEVRGLVSLLRSAHCEPALQKIIDCLGERRDDGTYLLPMGDCCSIVACVLRIPSINNLWSLRALDTSQLLRYRAHELEPPVHQRLHSMLHECLKEWLALEDSEDNKHAMNRKALVACLLLDGIHAPCDDGAECDIQYIMMMIRAWHKGSRLPGRLWPVFGMGLLVENIVNWYNHNHLMTPENILQHGNIHDVVSHTRIASVFAREFWIQTLRKDRHVALFPYAFALSAAHHDSSLQLKDETSALLLAIDHTSSNIVLDRKLPYKTLLKTLRHPLLWQGLYVLVKHGAITIQPELARRWLVHAHCIISTSDNTSDDEIRAAYDQLQGDLPDRSDDEIMVQWMTCMRQIGSRSTMNWRCPDFDPIEVV